MLRRSLITAVLSAFLLAPSKAEANGYSPYQSDGTQAKRAHVSRYVTPTTIAQPDPPWPARSGVCIAGCDDTQKGLVPRLPTPMPGGPSGASYTEFANGMECHDNGGCRVRGSIPFKRYYARPVYYHYFYYGW